ncbi:aminotransferase class I/II-fold pyridoxal phosphate-dependent enzyme [Arenibacter sp. GZD96]|uniref:aminotransferase class I/II-fold pyridoxal phosphate-dependent enzyme n=1 Tax=Aurantibrevibacter litoralis TaxID=3106030 RepID=UPI002AFE9B0A|nr:aminotransferase class I/II-fold pyridoxal phosphate-dependent enzyme [Arenibacter sp. GZD-96]MEA1786024.1 aminotransferase class I/II-fold pyridoxal phosphate-dependent enzyme [Arenibacter sp. GZD-96]
MTHYVDHFPGRALDLNGTTHLYFGGTSYLGIQTDVAFQDILIRNIRKYGTNYGASRKSNIRFSVFQLAEDHLAEMAGSEACITLSSGYLAGQAVRNYFGNRAGKLFYAPNTHSALYQTKIKPYATFTALHIGVSEHLATPQRHPPVLFLDAIDFSGNNYPHFESLKSLPLRDIILVVDDSHGFGIIGTQGGGVYAMLAALEPKELIVCASLGKSMGVQAGALFGSRTRIQEISDTDFFGGASPSAPAYMATLIEAASIYKQRRALLQQHLSYFLNLLKDKTPFNYMEGHPAFSFSDTQRTRFLKEHHILVTSFKYPRENAATMSRIVLSAAHTSEDIYRLAHVLNTY